MTPMQREDHDKMMELEEKWHPLNIRQKRLDALMVLMVLAIVLVVLAISVVVINHVFLSTLSR